MGRVTVFHTSDIHNKLTAEYARKLHDLKASEPGSLMFDSGDAIWSGNVYWRPGGEPVLDLMSSVPYDALCMGNREFHFLGIGMNAKVSKAQFPILSANLRSKLMPDSRQLSAPVPQHSKLNTQPVAPCAFLERDGMRIGVMGLSVPCVTERMLVKKVSDYYFEQPIAAARELVPRLREQCDLVIALTHIGIKHDRELAERVEGIDVILGGHTHTVTPEPERVGRTWILHHGFYIRYVGKVTADVESGDVRVSSELIPLAKA